MTILVTGATGAVGGQVVDRLLQDGHTVRATTRKPDAHPFPVRVQVAAADLTDASTLPPDLFDDVSSVFVFPATGEINGFVSAAAKAGVPRFVLLSSLAAAGDFERDLSSPSHVHHRAVEETITAQAPDWTILRPGTFANNLLSWSWPIRSGAPVRAPYIHSAQAPIHEADIAAVAVVALTQSGHSRRTYALSGPQALTRIEQVQAIGRGIGRDLELVEITPEEFRRDMSEYVPHDIISMLLRYWSDTTTTPDTVHTGVADVTGRSGRTLEQWAQDHRTDFTT